MREISMGFLLHDIGKSRIPTHILRKPGMLSVSEVKQLEKHPEYGVELMQHHQKVDPVSIDIIHNHHEKINGSGYPRRLPASRISLVTRICSVVDIFDALTSHRPYKPAMSGYQAMAFIMERMSHELDPEMLQLLAVILGPSHARTVA
jgi:HD-GYP domain-containing protein (c-di-GMP phosphodiesterase class II)